MPAASIPLTQQEDNRIGADNIEPKEYERPPGNVRMIQNDLEYQLFDAHGEAIENGVNTHAPLKKLISNFSRSVVYRQYGRGGTILYKDGETSIVFDWEFGGGQTVAIIFIPDTANWLKATKTPVNQRDEILTFVAEQAIRDQAPSGHYVIDTNTILILN
jgi:hypothetical protein